MHVGFIARTYLKRNMCSFLFHHSKFRQTSNLLCFHINYRESASVVDSLSTISPLKTTSSFFSSPLILANSSRQASSAIFSTGCSTAVIVGCTSVHNAVPDTQHTRTSSGIRSPHFCILLFAPINAVSVNPNTASNGMPRSRKSFIR